jgi:di/tricarboxylate transporter
VNLAAVSLAALFVAIVLSCVTKLNIGVVAIALAWIIGVWLGGFSVETIAGGFPVQLFLTLVGVTLLFTQAQLNGTLAKVTHAAVGLCRGNAGLIPLMFFLAAAVLASAGPGNIATAALMAPMAMAVAGHTGIPPLLMAIMVGNGANAGSLSPFAPTGIIANGLMAKAGMGGHESQIYWTSFAAHALTALTGYLLFGGLRLLRPRNAAAARSRAATVGGVPVPLAASIPGGAEQPLTRSQYTTLAAVAALLAAVLLLRVNIGMAAFAAATLLGLVRAADHSEAVRKMPWNVIVMVGGVTVLIALLEKTQGLALFTELLARISTRESVTATVAFVTGAVSVYSSTSGVVLPAFLPAAPGLAAYFGGADPVAIALSMNIGSHLVDVSPLSTIGALCIASAPVGVDARKLFNALLAWGLSMTVAGAVLCFALFRA